MAITTAMCTSFKAESWQATTHDLGNVGASPIGGDAIKLALITLASPEGTFGAASTNYSNLGSEETVDAASPQGYSPGGGTLTNNGVTTSGTTAYADFADLTFSSVNLTAHGCMIYNSSKGNRAISVHDFGGAKTASGGDFVIQFPAADSTNAILRLA